MSALERIQEINTILQFGDDRFINMVHAMALEYKKHNQEEWLEKLSALEKNDLNNSLEQIKLGQTSTRKDVMSRMQKKFPQLNFS